jgi:hypothetical protein
LKNRTRVRYIERLDPRFPAFHEDKRDWRWRVPASPAQSASARLGAGWRMRQLSFWARSKRKRARLRRDRFKNRDPAWLKSLEHPVEPQVNEPFQLVFDAAFSSSELMVKSTPSGVALQAKRRNITSNQTSSTVSPQSGRSILSTFNPVKR